MKYFFLLLFIVLMQSCFRSIEKNSTGGYSRQNPNIAFYSKSKEKRIVMLPASFIDAVFEYRKRNYEWPYNLQLICNNNECKSEYKKFIADGIESLEFNRITKDTLILNFIYSKRKHAKSNGRPDTYFPDIIAGSYLFVSDIRLFNVLIGNKNVE